jgi:hypothetical protein
MVSQSYICVSVVHIVERRSRSRFVFLCSKSPSTTEPVSAQIRPPSNNSPSIATSRIPASPFNHNHHLSNLFQRKAPPKETRGLPTKPTCNHVQPHAPQQHHARNLRSRPLSQPHALQNSSSRRQRQLVDLTKACFFFKLSAATPYRAAFGRPVALVSVLSGQQDLRCSWAVH